MLVWQHFSADISLMNKLILLFFLLFSSISLIAQDSIRLDQDFRFENGIYYSIQSLQKNKADIRENALVLEFEENKKRRNLHLESATQSGGEIPNEDIWAIVHKGKPYVRLINETSYNLPEVNNTVFVEVQIRAKIAYIPFQTYWVTEQKMPVYNPENGQIIKTYIDRHEEPVTLRQILNFETGEIKAFTKDNFLNWISDDQRLIETIENLNDEEAQQKLFKCLLIYNDRNYSYIRSLN